MRIIAPRDSSAAALLKLRSFCQGQHPAQDDREDRGEIKSQDHRQVQMAWDAPTIAPAVCELSCVGALYRAGVSRLTAPGSRGLHGGISGVPSARAFSKSPLATAGSSRLVSKSPCNVIVISTILKVFRLLSCIHAHKLLQRQAGLYGGDEHV